jgi:uncharacterized repeat protein (TIGR01451 family)
MTDRLQAAVALVLLLGFSLSIGRTPKASAQTCVPPPAGIVAWWPFDETSGTTAADVVGNNSATYINGVQSAPGMVGASVLLNGSGAYLGVPDSDLWAFGTTDFTIEFWANFAAPPGSDYGHPSCVFISNDQGSGDEPKWFFAAFSGNLEFHVNGPSLGPIFSPIVPFSPQVGQWYHLAVTRSGTNYSIFADGNLLGSGPNAADIPTPSAPLTIGQSGEPFGGFMNGRLDEMTIYNRALTQAELQAIVAAGSAGKCKTLAIRTSSLSLGQIGQPYSQQMEAIFGTPPLSWSVVSGTLPDGITLTSDGLLSGTPTQGGISTFTVRVTDANSATADRSLSLQVLATLPPPTLRITKTGTVPVPGRTSAYFIVVENIGSVTATNVSVIEFLQMENFSLVSVNPPALSDVATLANASLIPWTISTLAPGGSAILTYQVEVKPSVPIGQTVTGTACTVGDLIAVLLQFGQCYISSVVGAGAACSMCEPFCQGVIAGCPVAEIPIDLPICLGALADCGGCIGENKACLDAITEAFTDCAEAFEGSGEFVDSCFSFTTPTHGANDPNEKLVNAGPFIQPNQLLVYPIYFENDGNAAAQDVFVTDVLDQNLDPATVQIITPGGSFDPLTATVTWNLLGINLQPGDTSAVLFSARPLAGLPSGTAISNTATIQFDVFTPMTTNQVANIIDTTPPSCVMDPLPATSTTLAVPLSWSGTDMAGPVTGQIDTYSVFVSTNGGPYAAVVENTSATSASFVGAPGNSYGFICVAKDTAGNVEIQQPTPEATTSLTLASRSARACQRAVATAGAGYATARLKAIQTCRNSINSGRLPGVTPDLCPTERHAAAAIGRAGRAARKTIATKCTDSILSSLAACATTLDGLVSADGSAGCLVDADATGVDEALVAEYGVTLTRAQTAERACQAAIANAGGQYMTARLTAIRGCRTALLSGKHLFADKGHTSPITDVSACATEYGANASIDRAASRARATVASMRHPACTDAILTTIAPCATTVDSLVTPTGDGGCLLDSHAQVVTELLSAQYGQ